MYKFTIMYIYVTDTNQVIPKVIRLKVHCGSRHDN